jgi:hypothetical protein
MVKLSNCLIDSMGGIRPGEKILRCRHVAVVRIAAGDRNVPPLGPILTAVKDP